MKLRAVAIRSSFRMSCLIITIMTAAAGWAADQAFPEAAPANSIPLQVPSTLLPSEMKKPEPVVYSVYQGLNLGNPGEKTKKDFYISIGSSEGVHPGMILEVRRRVSTYDLMNEQLFRDMTFPVALIKVIHAESAASIARLEKVLDPDMAPVITPQAVMVGDVVRIRDSD